MEKRLGPLPGKTNKLECLIMTNIYTFSNLVSNLKVQGNIKLVNQKHKLLRRGKKILFDLEIFKNYDFFNNSKIMNFLKH